MALTILKEVWLALLILAVGFSQATATRSLSGMPTAVSHEQWMVQHGRTYKDATEKAQRFEIFKDNLERIESFNAQDHKFKLGLNQFADMTNAEFRTRNGLRPSRTSGTATRFKYENVTDHPATMDWRKKGAVTPIKDQGQCGSCWAFSTVASTEGITKLTAGKLVSLSEQELIDCDVKGDDKGCNGGYMEDGFKFIIDNKGLTTETDYPYTATDGTCNSKKAGRHSAAITGYETVPANDEAALLKAVAGQPVSVSIDAGDDSFRFYARGIFTGPCGTELDHGVTAVGYGVAKDGTEYWRVKNSWGRTWGEKGYVRMERDVNAKEGLCGIAMDASYPTTT